jgi:hypothetical protein
MEISEAWPRPTWPFLPFARESGRGLLLDENARDLAPGHAFLPGREKSKNWKTRLGARPHAEWRCSFPHSRSRLAGRALLLGGSRLPSRQFGRLLQNIQQRLGTEDTAPARDLYWRFWNHGISCNSILPGTIETPINAEYLSVGSNRVNLERQTCVGSIGMPSDLAGLVAFLARPEAHYITGASILVDGGEMVKHFTPVRLNELSFRLSSSR